MYIRNHLKGLENKECWTTASRVSDWVCGGDQGFAFLVSLYRMLLARDHTLRTTDMCQRTTQRMYNTWGKIVRNKYKRIRGAINEAFKLNAKSRGKLIILFLVNRILVNRIENTKHFIRLKWLIILDTKFWQGPRNLTKTIVSLRDMAHGQQ